MIKIEQFEELSNCPTSSWAIWTDKFNKKGCIEGEPGQPKNYFIKNLFVLKNNIILLGLNPSEFTENRKKLEDKKCINLSESNENLMRNFHTVGHRGDNCLKETICNLNNIQGAYMTDLAAVIKTDSNKVIIRDEDIEIFKQKLEILGANNFHVICFGDKTFYAIFNYFKNKGTKIKIEINDFAVKEYSTCLDEKNIKLYGILHYSYVVNGRGNHRRNDFERQMEYVNNKL